MDYISADNQHILHCINCGGSFFEENGINRISVNTGQKLAEEKITDEISGQEKLCPKDKAPLFPIRNEQSIPAEITLLRCSKCHGVFAFPDDLLKFKQAQAVKIEFYKLWNQPLPSVKTVLVFSFLIITSISLFAGINSISKRLSNQSQAQDVIKKVYISTSGHYLFINFITQISLRSEIIFNNKSNGIKIIKIVSKEPTTVHNLVTGDVNFEDEIYYQIILIDTAGKRFETSEKKLEIK